MLTERIYADKSSNTSDQHDGSSAEYSDPNKPLTKTKQLFEKKRYALEQQFVKQLSEPSHVERRTKNKLLKAINNQHFSQEEALGTSNSSSSNSNSRPSTADLIGCSSTSRGVQQQKTHEDSESNFIRNIANRLKAARNLIRSNESAGSCTERSQSVSSDRHYSVNASKRRQHSLDANAERLSNHSCTARKAASGGSKPDSKIGSSSDVSGRMEQKAKTLRCIKLRAMSTAPSGGRMAASISSSHGNLESICKTAPTSRKQLLDPIGRQKNVHKEKVQAVKSSECVPVDSPIYKRVQTFDNCAMLKAVDCASSSPSPTATVQLQCADTLTKNRRSDSKSDLVMQKASQPDSVENKEVHVDNANANANTNAGGSDCGEKKHAHVSAPEEKDVHAENSDKKPAIRTESNDILKHQLDTVLRSMMAEFESFAGPGDAVAKKQQSRSDSSDRLVTPTPTHNVLAQSRSHDSQAVESNSSCSRTPSSQNLPFTPVFMRQFASASSSVSASVSGAVTPLSPAPKLPHMAERVSSGTVDPCAVGPPREKSPVVANANANASNTSKDATASEKVPRQEKETTAGRASVRKDVGSQLPMSRLTVAQLHKLRKMAFVSLASLLEVHCPSFKLHSDNWSLFRLRRKKEPIGLGTAANSAIAAISPPPKLSSASLKNACHTMFGVPLEILQMRLQQSLPVCVLQAMRFLERETREKDPSSASQIAEGSVCCSDVVGIFRKSGNRKNVEELRRLMEMEVESDKPKASIFDLLNITTFTVYDVADCVKQFFRELPECLLTQKISEALIAVYENVPEEARLDVLRYGVLLLPDANREVLMTLLHFLKALSVSCKRHQMNASNLAVCFAPSLFYFPNSVMSASGGTTSAGALRRARRATGIPDMKELQKQKAAQLCLTDLIAKSDCLFVVDLHCLRPQRSVSNVFERSPANLDAKTGVQGVQGSVTPLPNLRQRCNTLSMRNESSEKENDQDDAYSVASLAAEKRNKVVRLSSGHGGHTLCRSMTEPFAKSCTTLIDNHLSTIVREYRTEKQRKKRGWMTVNLPPGIIRQGAQPTAEGFFAADSLPTLAYKKLVDVECDQESELHLWRSTIVIDESVEALFAILVNEAEWNSAASNWHIVTQLDQSSDVVKFQKNDAFCGGRPDENGHIVTMKDYCVVRHSMHCKTQQKQMSNSTLSLANAKKDIAVYLCTSINENLLYDPVSLSTNENQVAWVFERCFVLEPLSTVNLTQQRTLVTLFWREDVRGKTADWYMRFWPQQCYLELVRLKQYLLKHLNAQSCKAIHNA